MGKNLVDLEDLTAKERIKGNRGLRITGTSRRSDKRKRTSLVTYYVKRSGDKNGPPKQAPSSNPPIKAGKRQRGVKGM